MSCRLLLLAAVIAAASTTTANTLTFDENVIPVNPLNGFGSFTFDDFGAPGAVTTTATSIVLDVQDSDSSNGVFGGLGVDFVIEDPPTSGTFVPQDFDAATTRWEMRIKLLPDNAATAIRTTFIDDDGAGTADEHIYEYDLTSVPADGQFHTLYQPVSAPLFTQGAFGFVPGNGAVDPGLRQIQIQSVFGSSGRLNVEIDFVRIIPEPNALLLAVFASIACFARRRDASPGAL